MTALKRYKPNTDARVHAIEWPAGVTAEEFLASVPKDWRDRDMLSLEDDGSVTVRTNQGLATMYATWFLIFGTAAEFYPVPPAIFNGRWVLDA